MWPNNNKLHTPPQNSKHYQVPFGNDANFVNHPGVAVIKIQPNFPEFLLDMQYFCNFSLVSLGIRPRSRRCAERTRQGEGRWSRPLKAALERSYIRPRIPVPRIAYFGRDGKKTPDQIPDINEGFYIDLFRSDKSEPTHTDPLIWPRRDVSSAFLDVSIQTNIQDRQRDGQMFAACSLRSNWQARIAPASATINACMIP